MLPQDYGMPSYTPFYNILSPDSSSIPPSLLHIHGTSSTYLSLMDRHPSPNTTSSKATQPISLQLFRSNIGVSNSEMFNSETSPSFSSTLSSVHGPDLPPPEELYQLQRVHIIADEESPDEDVISLGIQKLYDGFYPIGSDVSSRMQQGVLNEFMFCQVRRVIATVTTFCCLVESAPNG
ncbi:uncharacterized protein LOC124895934 isoform X1 [Capsicum annuum]|uniref:uncharacterized protein LOC124895934 isoform X1 n=1 Tax=Capsicum annuum TaxID=4072 RepID=UPI001FB15336|nr:uncharacterized protein LOC124895934 isoform X1 [Capsicum annuum]